MAMEFTIGGSDDAPKRPATASTAPKSTATGAKRGRPPGPSTKQRDNVAGALSTMDNAYNALCMGAVILQKPLTAELIATKSEQWQDSNRGAFESSPKLAAAIANVGQASGVVTFAITNVIAIGSILLTLRQETAAQLAARQEASAPDNG